MAVSAAMLAFLIGTSEVVHAECRPAAIPVGDASLVQSVSERLVASGVATVATDGCPVVRVHLERRGEQLHLQVADGHQRRGERAVQDVATAAAVIESWTLQEIEEGELQAAAPSPPSVAGTRQTVLPYGIGAAVRTAVTEQRSTWMGGTVAACRRLRSMCIGARLDLAMDIEATGAASTDDHRLVQVETRATVELPRALGAFVVSSGLSLGFAWQRISSDHLDIHMQPFTQIESSKAMRAGVHFRIARAVSSSISIFSELAADRSFVRTGPTLGPETWFGLSLGARIGSP